MEVSRIRELLEARQLSPTQFADHIGVGRPVISHILSGRNEPSLKVVRSIIEAFPDVSLAWIMTGTGPMLTASAPTASVPDTTTAPTASASPPLNAATAAIPAPFIASAPPTAPVVFSPAVPAPLAVVAPAPAPVTASPAAVPIQQLPQPPKFRFPAKAATQPALPITTPTPLPKSDPIPEISPSTPSLAVAPAASSTILPNAPTPVPEPVVPPIYHAPPGAAEPPIAPIELPAPPPAPAYSPGPETFAAVPTPPPAIALAPVLSVAPTPVSQPNPAAAFSFLSEAGKTVRRIVLFYSDGSFSDYRPEGQ